MGLLELFLIAVGLSMDAFAVAVCQGLCMPKLNLRHGAVIALFFGGFQALMPLLGWVLGSQFASYIQNIDHWVAFVLLALIGGNMIREAMSPEDGETACAVDYRLVPVVDPQRIYPYPQWRWAEPDPACAAGFLREIARKHGFAL